MAATVIEQYTWDLVCQRGASPEEDVRIYVLDLEDVNVVDGYTDGYGVLAQQTLVRASHSVTGSATTTTLKTPHDSRALKYGINIFAVSKQVSGASQDTYFLTTNDFITESNKATVKAFTGIDVNHSLRRVTVTEDYDLENIYDFLQVESIDNPQDGYVEIMSTVDGNVFNLLYDFTIDGYADISAAGKTLNMPNNLFTLISGSFDGIVIDKTGTRVIIRITVRDIAGNPIENAQTAVFRTSDNLQLMNEDTDGYGVAIEPFQYTTDTAVTLRVRKASPSNPRYENFLGAGTITNFGFTSEVRLIEDPNNPN